MFVRLALVLGCLFIPAGVCLASGATTMPAEPAVQMHLIEVLDNIRTAIGFDALNQLPTMESVGTLISWDRNKDSSTPENVQGKYRLIFTPQGLFRFVGTTGATSLDGFDGIHQWTMDYSGAPYSFDDPSSLLFYWTISGCWLSRIDDLSLPSVECQTSKNEIILEIGLNRDHAKRWMIIDRRTWLPKTLCPVGHPETPQWEFKDYRRTMGVRFPSEIITYTTDSDSPSTPASTIKIDRITKADRVDHSLYAMPQPLDNVRFQKYSAASVECKLTETGHVLVKANINGERPRWFAFDCGTSVLTVDRDVSEELDLPTVDELGGLISGSPAHAKTVRCRQLKIGPMTIAKPIFWSIPLDVFRFMMDEDVIGIIGYDVFRRAVVEFDAAAPTVRLIDPGRYDGSNLNWQPFRYSKSKLIHVLCKFEGNHQAYFTIDSGSNGGLSIRTETYKALGLKTPEKPPSWRFNFGGATITRSSTKTDLAWFEIGGHRLSDLKVDLDDHLEHYVGVNNVGAIGLKILSRFKVVFDYPHMRIAFVSKKEKQPAQTETPAALRH